MADAPAAELTLDEPEVRALLGSVSPALARLPLHRLAEGWDNVTWRLGDDLVVRVPRRALSAPLIRNEQRALPLLAPALASVGVLAPLPVVAGAPTADFPWAWSVLPWLPGQPALARPRDENTAWAPQLARALLALHGEAPADAPANPVRGAPLATRDESIRERLAALPSETASILRPVWQSGIEAPASVERVWIHGDLHPGNILVSGSSLTALIDFGDVTAGDPAYDLAAAWMCFDVAGRRAFREATGARYDDATWVRARAWATAVATTLAVFSDDRDDLRAAGDQTIAALVSSAPPAP